MNRRHLLVVLLVLEAWPSTAFLPPGPRQTYTEEEAAFREISHGEWIDHQNYLDEDGRRERLPMPEGHNSSHCSAHCQRVAGDAVCNIECDKPGCLRDLGDCKYYGLCHPMACPNDGKCRHQCELRGCNVGTCVLDTKKDRQFVIVDLPLVNPYSFFGQFEKMENFMEKQLGYWVSLQGYVDGPMVWGFERDTYAVKRLKYTDTIHQQVEERDGDREALQNRTLAVFSVDAKKILTELDKRDLDVISRLGTPDIMAAVIMMMIKKKDTAEFNEKMVTIPREEQEIKRRLKRRPRRHLEDDEEEEENLEDENMD